MFRANGLIPSDAGERSSQGPAGFKGVPAGQGPVSISELMSKVKQNLRVMKEDTKKSQGSEDKDMFAARLEGLIQDLDSNPDYFDAVFRENIQTNKKPPHLTAPRSLFSIQNPADFNECWPSVNTTSLYQQSALNKLDSFGQMMNLNPATFPKQVEGDHLAADAGNRATVKGSVEGYQAPPGIKVLRYKTELCRTITMKSGNCRYGDKCQYAHSNEELRNIQKHPRYKTERCRQYFSGTVCNYGPRCNFLHEEDPNSERIVALRGCLYVPPPTEPRFVSIRPASASSSSSADSGTGSIVNGPSWPQKVLTGDYELNGRQISLESLTEEMNNLSGLSPVFGEGNGPKTGGSDEDLVFSFFSTDIGNRLGRSGNLYPIRDGITKENK